ncbi:MAG TPA: ERCC4 domain-containing protein [Virgibacillus sp.]|nr:ERCC4 domain-containing protein [Virgibacillus sp.]
MISPRYTYTAKEVKELLATIVILIDTREQKNQHIIDYLNKKGIPYKGKKLDYGDYSAYIPKNADYGILRDTHIPVYVERKNSIDELASTIKERTRFENELIRSQRSEFLLLVEDEKGYENIVTGRYRSEYQSKALLASLMAFEARYGFKSVFVSKLSTPNYIYHHLYYNVRETLN